MASSISIPDVHSFESLIEKAHAKAGVSKPPRAAILLPADIDALQAFLRAGEEGLIEPTAVADGSTQQTEAATHGIDISRINIIQAPAKKGTVETAARLAGEAKIDLIVQGQMDVGEMLGTLFRKDVAFRQRGGIVSHVAVMKPEKYPKLLLLTDGAVVPRPDLQAKIDLIQNLIFVSERIGIPHPRIAVVTAVEAIYPQMPATLDGAVLAKMSDRGQIKGAVLDGPLSFDVAVDPLAAQAKGITGSPVAGQADAMIASTIEVANGIYHAMSLYGRCDIGGIIVGGRVPVAVNACADSLQARFHSIVLGVLTA